MWILVAPSQGGRLFPHLQSLFLLSRDQLRSRQLHALSRDEATVSLMRNSRGAPRPVINECCRCSNSINTPRWEARNVEGVDILHMGHRLHFQEKMSDSVDNAPDS